MGMTVMMGAMAPETFELIRLRADFEAVREAFAEHYLADLDKAFDGASSLLDIEGFSGTDIIFGSGGVEETDPEDLSEEVLEAMMNGETPLFFIPPPLVQQINQGLQLLDEAELRRRFDPVALEQRGAYPLVWDRADEQKDNADWVVGAAMDVVALFAFAAANGLGVCSDLSI
jgi:hypothetical protein